MLASLKIENVAVIEKAEVNFTPGFNVLTGETGAGKSILIDSINAILGNRTSRELVRSGAQKACIWATFESIPASVKKQLEKCGYEVTDDLLLYREINAEGKGSCRVNGMPATAAVVRDISSGLLSIHGQHDSQSLTNPALHLGLLDQYAQNRDLFAEYYRRYRQLVTVKRQLDALNASESDKQRRIEALTAEIEKLIGSGFRKDATELEKLLPYTENVDILQQFSAVKAQNKRALADWLHRTQGITVDPDAMFDIQSKRLHEYKRQQLNLLYLIHQYYEIKAGHLPAVPLVSIFGAKAAPAYTIAKDIIHALLTLSKVIAADPEVSKWLQVVFVENYNVTAAEKLIPACDLSEQISLASKEASGTGNMKFMLNGALTLGTMDGANVEICQQVGEENIYIFGQTSDQVIHRYAAGDYCAAQWYEGDANIRRAIDFLTGPEMLAAGHAENLTRLHDELVHKDWFQTLPDFNAYVVRKGQALNDYACDPLGWRKKCLVNIAKAGFFSSDRTIGEYDRDIWHLGQ